MPTKKKKRFLKSLIKRLCDYSMNIQHLLDFIEIFLQKDIFADSSKWVYYAVDCYLNYLEISV